VLCAGDGAISGRPTPQMALRHPAIVRDYVVTTLEISCCKTRIIRDSAPRQRDLSPNYSLLSSGNALQISNNPLQVSGQIHIFQAIRGHRGHSETRIIRYLLPQDQGGVAVFCFYSLPGCNQAHEGDARQRRSDFETRNIAGMCLPAFTGFSGTDWPLPGSVWPCIECPLTWSFGRQQCFETRNLERPPGRLIQPSAASMSMVVMPPRGARPAFRDSKQSESFRWANGPR